jgi:hypothetical protein
MIWWAWLRAVARSDGAERERWEAQGKVWGLGMKQDWVYPTALKLQPVLAAAAREPRLDFGLLASLRIYKTAQGIAVVMDHNENGNTGPLMCGVTRNFDGITIPETPAPPGLAWGPPLGGERIRQKMDAATCTIADGAVHYHSPIQGKDLTPLDLSLPLPGGPVQLDRTFGTSGDPAPVPISPISPVQPVNPVEPPVPAKDRQALYAQIAGWAKGWPVAPVNRPLQEKIVTALRSPDPAQTPAAIADLIQTLGLTPDIDGYDTWVQAQKLLRDAGACPNSNRYTHPQRKTRPLARSHP